MSTAVDSNDKSKTARGIPEAQFIDDVEAFMAKQKGTAQEIVKQQDELLSKYRFMESHLVAQQKKWKTQVPDIENCLKVVGELKKRKESQETMETRYCISEEVHMQAVIEPTDKVCLWLGANVMLEYDLESAEELLKENLEKAKIKIESVLTDLDYLRTQCTTTEVTIARLHNWHVNKNKTQLPAC